jgi:sugar phosphate isomerase/epimerase
MAMAGLTARDDSHCQGYVSMKICFSSFTCPSLTLPHMLNTARGFGYHGVELRCDAQHHHGVEINTAPEVRALIAQEFQNQGIEPVCLATSVQMTHDHAAELLVGRIHLAADIGCPAVRVFCGRDEESSSLADTIEVVVERLGRGADYALSMGVQVWLETHDTSAKGQIAGQIIREVDRENVGIVYNNLHPYRMNESVRDTFIAIGQFIRHVRFHDGINDPRKVVVTPMGQGQLPVEDMFDALVNTGYDGYLCGEWFNNQYAENADDALDLYYKEIVSLTRRHGVALEATV